MVHVYFTHVVIDISAVKYIGKTFKVNDLLPCKNFCSLRLALLSSAPHNDTNEVLFEHITAALSIVLSNLS